ncbi:MAG: right-handed parallel beta-helix repeat-containing protein [Thermoplasmata archaeon]|nr:MAG: right-handed parallel beta-helix repeat-containing protein [Thermoplasmata archaeon]
MSSHLSSSKGARLLLVTLLALATIVALATFATAEHPDDQDLNNGGTGLSEFTGDWNVGTGDDLMYANQTISLDGNLTVSDGGALILSNVTLILHGGEFDAQEILVFDGSLSIIEGSEVRAEDPDFNYYFQVYEDATFVLTDSNVRDCGRLFNLLGIQAGLYIASDDVTIANCDITFGYGGLFIDGVGITVEDCLIKDNTWIGVYVDHRAAPTLKGCSIVDNLREGIMVKDQSDLTLDECFVRGNLRGVVVDGAFMAADGTAISGNEEVDIDLPYFSQVELSNCTVTTSGAGEAIRMENSSLTSTHGNFDIDEVDMEASLFRYQQFLTVKVTWGDSRLTPIEGAQVKVEDAEMNSFFYTTDSEGMVSYIPMLVVEYDKTTPILKTTSFNPFHVTATFNLLDKDTYADMRYDNALVAFQYTDGIPPVAQAPLLSEVDVGINTTLDGSACYDNVAIETWNWSFDEFGQKIYLEGEQVEYAFREAKIYSITLKVVDTSGNSNPGSSVKFDVTARDRIPPVADAGPDQTVEQGTVVTLDGSGSEDNVGIVEYTWSFTYDGAPRSLTGKIVTWEFAIPGVYLVVLSVSDAAGLTDTDETTIIVEDTTPPVTEVTFNPDMPMDRKFDQIVQIIFNVDDVGGGTVELNYRINGMVWEKVVGSLSLSFGGDLQYGDGTYEIEYYAEDQTGNTEELQTIEEFLVDATAPTFTNMEPPISPYTVTTETYVISGKTEPGASLSINDWTTTVGDDGVFSYEATLVEGDNPFYLHAEDSVGHTADMTIIITRTEYDNGNGNGGDGGSLLLYGIVGAIVLIVIVLLFFFMVIQKKDGDEGGAGEM